MLDMNPIYERSRTVIVRPARSGDGEAVRAIRNHAVEHSTALWTQAVQSPAQGAAWLAAHVDCIRVLEMEYRDLVSDPTSAARTVNTFLDGKLDEVSMKAAVNPSLYRNRRSDRDA